MKKIFSIIILILCLLAPFYLWAGPSVYYGFPGDLGTPTSGNFSTGTFTWPTFNQNTSGTAANLSGTPTLPANTILVTPNIGAATGTSLSVTTLIGTAGNITGLTNLGASNAVLTGGIADNMTIGQTTAGAGYFKIPETVANATANITAPTLYGSILNNNGQAANTTLSLPAIAQGMSFDAVITTTVAKYFNINPADADVIYLDGVADTAGHYVGMASAAVGGELYCKAVLTAAGVYSWFCTTIQGAWAME